MSDLYKKAALKKLRFDTSRGQITVEDLFSLPLTSTTGRINLNDIAKGLHKQVKDAVEVDFVGESTQADSDAALGLEIVKDVIAHRKAEAAAAQQRVERESVKQQIMAVIEHKKAEAFSSQSIEELQAQLAKL